MGTEHLSKDVRVFATSDIHGQLEGLDPTGFDLAIIAGDIEPAEIGVDKNDWLVNKFLPWVMSHQETEFVVIPGNHDFFAPHGHRMFQWADNLHFLIDEEVKLFGLRIYGTPWVPPINGRWMFEAEDEDELHDRFASIPEGIDILVTHSPPKIQGHFIDMSLQYGASRHFGSTALADAIQRVNPTLVFCGHIHSGDHEDCLIPLKNAEHNAIAFNVSRIDETYTIAYPPRTLWITDKAIVIDPLKKPESIIGTKITGF